MQSPTSLARVAMPPTKVDPNDLFEMFEKRNSLEILESEDPMLVDEFLV